MGEVKVRQALQDLSQEPGGYRRFGSVAKLVRDNSRRADTSRCRPRLAAR